MKIKRVVDSVALLALIPAAGVIACGSEAGPDQNPTPQTQLPPGTVIGNPPPGGTAWQPPSIGGNQPPPSGTGAPAPTGTGLPPAPTGTGVPPAPTGTGVPPAPTGTGVPPAPTGTGVPPAPTGTGVPPAPTGTAPPPTPNGLPQISYDTNHILLPPDPSNGIQISTPTFTLQPGSEVFRCYHTSIPSSTETDVGRWVSQMTPGSHHFILYAGGTGADGQMDQSGCAGFGNQWVYASSSPDNQLAMPDGVAMPMAANQKIEFDMHYINTSSAPLSVHILLNVDKVTGTNFQRAGALVSFNTGISIPPMGTQTVSGTCTTSPTQNFFLMSTHTHKHATLATIHVGNAQGQELVHTTDWENPDFKMWQTAPFFNFQAGQGLYYACSYQNDTTSTIRVGTSAITNEMCMAISYYFPASGGGGISCN